jgi:hypothetical protein
MLPLHEDAGFTFRFADDRLIPRFHLEGVPAGRQVSVFKIDPGSGARLDLLAKAAVGAGGWVDLPKPIVVRAGEAFLAVPQDEGAPERPGNLLLRTLAVAGLLALLGYLCGLIRGDDNQFVLAVCGGGLGAFVVLLGYGPVALLVRALAAVADGFRRNTKRTNGRQHQS